MNKNLKILVLSLCISTGLNAMNQQSEQQKSKTNQFFSIFQDSYDSVAESASDLVNDVSGGSSLDRLYLGAKIGLPIVNAAIGENGSGLVRNFPKDETFLTEWVYDKFKGGYTTVTPQPVKNVMSWLGSWVVAANETRMLNNRVANKVKELAPVVAQRSLVDLLYRKADCNNYDTNQIILRHIVETGGANAIEAFTGKELGAWDGITREMIGRLTNSCTTSLAATMDSKETKNNKIRLKNQEEEIKRANNECLRRDERIADLKQLVELCNLERFAQQNSLEEQLQRELEQEKRSLMERLSDEKE